jgi:hypothetical protein
LAEDEEMKRRLPVFILKEVSKKISAHEEHLPRAAKSKRWLPRFLRAKT